MNTIEWAEAFYREHVACTEGHDRGPIVDAFLEYAGASAGEPWCASFVSYCAHKGMVDAFTEGARSEGSSGVSGLNGQNGLKGLGDPPFRSASSQAIKRWALESGKLFTDSQKLLECKGALGGWTDEGDSSHGHVFFIERRLTSVYGRVVKIGTIEGNSDTTPDNAVNRLVRTAPMSEGHELWFVDVGDVSGCAWFL